MLRSDIADPPTRVPEFRAGLARTPAEVHAAQRLRYDVFVTELGADGPLVDHATRREQDRFDPAADHLILRDMTRPPEAQVVGTYRLLTQTGAAGTGGFYSETEFDLTALHNSGRTLLELGRSCLHPAYRGGAAMVHLWGGLADYVAQNGTEILFGVASFPTTDLARIAAPLSHLHHAHLAPKHLRVASRIPAAYPHIDPAQMDRLAAMRATPALIKAYLRVGGTIGQGAFVDTAFNTTDVCMIFEADQLRQRAAALYAGKGPAT